MNNIEQNECFENFYKNILERNVPCLISNEISLGWNAIKDWVTCNGSPNLESLFQYISNKMDISVCNCSVMEFGSHKVECLTVSDYIQYMKDHKQALDNRIFYLKDWHYVRDVKVYSPYEVPIFFSSDWMNEFWDFRKDLNDDFRFVYFGPKNSWTALHMDVYRSYSWSANVCGRKKWFLLEPGEEDKLRYKDGKLPPDLRGVDLTQIQHLEVIQEPGQIIFVPSGWFHQVINLTDCISINHNWMNACNVEQCWLYLQKQLAEVRESMTDVMDTPGWEDACQSCLRAYSGINYEEFHIFLKYILVSRLLCYQNKVTINRDSPRWSESSFHQLLENMVPESERSCLEDINSSLNSVIINEQLNDPLLRLLSSDDCPEFWLERLDCQSVCRVYNNALKSKEFTRLLTDNDNDALKSLNFDIFNNIDKLTQ